MHIAYRHYGRPGLFPVIAQWLALEKANATDLSLFRFSLCGEGLKYVPYTGNTSTKWGVRFMAKKTSRRSLEGAVRDLVDRVREIMETALHPEVPPERALVPIPVRDEYPELRGR